jgi:hypothetical protein
LLKRALAPSLVALLLVVVAAGCGGGEPDAFAVRGRTMEIVFERPVVGKRVFFTNADISYKIEVADPSTRIAAVKVTVINRQINITKLRVGSDSVFIGNGRIGERHGAISPFHTADTYTGEIPEEESFSPLLWDDFELERGFQSSGWIFFEVPVGTDLDTLWWSAADDIIGRF